MKNLDELLDNIKNKDYEVKTKYPTKFEGYKKDNYVYDENKTVKWNKEHYEELMNNYQKQLQDYNIEVSVKNTNFKNDFIDTIVNEYKLNKNSATHIFYKAWEIGHSEGISNIVYEAKDILDFIIDIIKIEKGEMINENK